MEFGCRQMISFNDRICYWSVVRFPSVAALTPWRPLQAKFCLDLHLLQVFVGRIFVSVILHLVQVAFLWCQHRVHLGKQSRPQQEQLRMRHVMNSSAAGTITSFTLNWFKFSSYNTHWLLNPYLTPCITVLTCAVYHLGPNPRTRLQLTCCSPPRCRGWWCRIASSSKAPGRSQSQLLWPRRSPADQSVRCCRSWSPLPGAGRIPSRWVFGWEKKGGKKGTQWRMQR